MTHAVSDIAWTDEHGEHGFHCARYGDPEGQLYVEVVRYAGDPGAFVTAQWGKPGHREGLSHRHQTFEGALLEGTNIIRVAEKREDVGPLDLEPARPDYNGWPNYATWAVYTHLANAPEFEQWVDRVIFDCETLFAAAEHLQKAVLREHPLRYPYSRVARERITVDRMWSTTDPAGVIRQTLLSPADLAVLRVHGWNGETPLDGHPQWHGLFSCLLDSAARRYFIWRDEYSAEEPFTKPLPLDLWARLLDTILEEVRWMRVVAGFRPQWYDEAREREP